MELVSRRKRIGNLSAHQILQSGNKPVLLAIDDDYDMMLTQMFTISIGSVVTIMGAIVIAIVHNDAAMDSLLVLIGAYIFFFSMSLIAKILVTRSLRTLFIATDVEIRSGLLTRKGFKEKRSIQWKNVTKIEVDPFIMTIQGAYIEIKMKLLLENYEPLFEIMRTKVARKALTKDASDFISKPVASIPGTVIMKYSKWAKIFFLIMSIFLWAVLWGAYIYAPGDKTFISWTGIVLIVMTIFPIIALLELSYSNFKLFEEGIERRSFLFKKAFIGWNEVDSIKYRFGEHGNFYRIKGAGKKIELDGWLDELPQFSKYVVNKVPPEKWDTAKWEIVRDIRD
jgi:hypothetical protein